MSRFRCLAAAGLALLASCQPPAGPPTTAREMPPAPPPQSGVLPPGPHPKPGYPGGKEPLPETTDQLCNWLQGAEGEDLNLLAREGEKLYPRYQEVLDDPKRGDRSTSCVLSILWRVAQDAKLRPEVSKQFLGPALRHLGDEDHGVRISALGLLQVIGGERDTAPVAVMLLAERTEVRYAAAKTLAGIGGPADVVALDLVIKNADRYFDKEGKRLLPAEYDVKHFEKCKAELEARLKKQEKDKAEPKK